MPAFDPDGALEDVRKIQLSTGKLPFPPDLQVVRSGVVPNSIDVNWTREMKCNGYRLSDELMVVSAADSHYSEITQTGIKRGDLQGTFVLPLLRPFPGTHIYLMFTSKDHRDYSTSVCFELS